MPGHPDGIISAALGGSRNNLYTPGHPDVHVDSELECDTCATDILDDFILYSYHMAWYRLGEKCFKMPSHNNNDALTASTARPPGAE